MPATSAKEPSKEAVEQGMSISLPDLSKELMDDSASHKKSGRWPLVLDPSGTSATFLRYQNVNMINAVNPANMSPEAIRMAVLGGLRYGKPVVLDMEGSDLFDACVIKFDDVQKGLMEDILSREIMKNNKFLSLIRDTDGAEYQPEKFTSEVDNFMFVIVTKIAPPSSLRKRTFVIELK